MIFLLKPNGIPIDSPINWQVFLLLPGTSLMPQTTNQRYALDGGLAGFGFSHATWPSLESYSTPKGFEKKPADAVIFGMFLGKTLETNKTSFKMILTVFVVRVESKTWWSCCQHHLRCKMETPGVRPWLRCVSCFTTRPMTRKPFTTIQPAKTEGKITSQAPKGRWLDYILVSIISHQNSEHFPLNLCRAPFLMSRL